MFRFVCFGEIMGRITPGGFLRFQQAFPGSVEFTFGGAEANVAASLAMMGSSVDYVTALPRNAIADACIADLRSLGIGTDNIVRTDSGRLGLYFLETGANQRPSKVVYDREHSSVSLTPFGDYDWDAIFRDASWFHISGITPALSATAAEAVEKAAATAAGKGIKVSCDLNFRKNLWKWDGKLKSNELAKKVMTRIIPHLSVLVGNEEDAGDVLGIHAENTDVEKGSLDISRYPDVARKIAAQFPNLEKIACTLRESVSATHNNWGAMLFDTRKGTADFAPLENGTYRPYEIRDIVDRVGGGDAFSAGLIFALNDPALSAPGKAVAFAAAASCLAHSISGDFNYISRSEAEALMKGSGSGRVIR